jgi:Txe/YoeB family toxin of Txe-Axe toxin-antitoxin module
MTRISKVILQGEAKEEYEKLKRIVLEQKERGKDNSDEIALFRSIKEKAELLKIRPEAGINIPKKYIPSKYDVTNLWKLNLSSFWRMIYTIKGDKIEVVCFVLDIIPHDKYNKIFRYRKN